MMAQALKVGLDVGIYGRLATRDHILELAELAEASGLESIWVADHVIFPSTFVYLPLVENANAAYICARAYNDWAYDYCSAEKKRLYPAAVLPVQNVDYAIEELRRVAKRGEECGYPQQRAATVKGGQ